jgi:hypothetical protein
VSRGMQGGSGLKITGALPYLPAREGDCRASVQRELGNDCVTQAPCTDCESFPVVPVREAITWLNFPYATSVLAATKLRGAAEHRARRSLRAHPAGCATAS